MPIDLEHKFKDGDRVVFLLEWHDRKIPSTVVSWEGNKIYAIKSDDGWRRFAYEHELEPLEATA